MNKYCQAIIDNRHKPFVMYRLRDGILKKMGYESYPEYLKSDFWLDIKTRVLERDDHICQICGSPTTIVHHRRYDLRTLQGIKSHLKKIISLCSTCHYDVEIGKSGNKREFWDAERILDEMLWKRELRESRIRINSKTPLPEVLRFARWGTIKGKHALD